MHAIDQHSYALATPIFLGLLAAICAGMWLLQQRYRYLLWQSSSHAIAALALALPMLRGQADEHHIATGMTALYLLAAITLTQAIAMRMGRRIKLAFVIPVSALTLAGMWYYSAVEASLATRMVMSACAMALILSHVLPSLWKAPKRHVADRIAVGWFSLGAWCMWIRPIALWADDPAYPVQVVSDSAIWWGTSMLIVAGSALYASVLIACTLMDSMFQLRTERDHDALTNLLSRRAFEEVCTNAPHERGFQVLVLCDLDHFKSINDLFGHSAGDEVLQHFAQLLKACSRESDVVARFDGEEFVLALPHTHLDQGKKLIERIQQQMCHTCWSAKAQLSRLTASFGMVKLIEGEALDKALHRADLQLYAAKEAGRNCLFVEGETPVARSAPRQPEMA